MSRSHRSRLGGRRDGPRRSLRSMELMIRKGYINCDASCTNKIAYSVGGAEAARRSMGRKRKRTGIYHCRFCGNYHLTSMGQ